MSRIRTILEFNDSFVQQEKYKQYKTTKYPDRKLVILTCMDTRLSELLPQAMGLKNGDAKIIKNAGATISHPFGSIMRSILLAIYELKAEEVCVIGHHNCGMADLQSSSILEGAKRYGIPEDHINTLMKAGIDLSGWLTGFNDINENITNTVNIIKNHPLFPDSIVVHGLVIHSETGKLDVVVDGHSLQKETIETIG